MIYLVHHYQDPSLVHPLHTDHCDCPDILDSQWHPWMSTDKAFQLHKTLITASLWQRLIICRLVFKAMPRRLKLQSKHYSALAANFNTRLGR